MHDLERVTILPKVWEEVEAQAGEQQMVVWILQATLLQNAYRDFYKAVWDGKRWGVNREVLEEEKSGSGIFTKEGYKNPDWR